MDEHRNNPDDSWFVHSSTFKPGWFAMPEFLWSFVCSSRTSTPEHLNEHFYKENMDKIRGDSAVI